ncbi:glutaredoxin domain-containing protein [Nesterenkonia sp. CL21]|uniref:glutaredoxin domain-containing protein n=1 Tax=Nesterenkonia sp. CL21 TaxID=3064894 RepID=UPI002879EFD4|nr:glutaredoxin domain-containing protein [Nesterenkonia sp. CL21]MDS2171622.1 glutaredoxin domain-containing protein [Nesterenkonia sp. CL21]
MITVWSKPNCVQCNAVKRHLDKNGIPYEERDLTLDPDKLLEFKDRGLAQAPVVESSTRDTFTGFNPYKLDELVEDAWELVAGCGEEDCCRTPDDCERP